MQQEVVPGTLLLRSDVLPKRRKVLQLLFRSDVFLQKYRTFLLPAGFQRRAHENH